MADDDVTATPTHAAPDRDRERDATAAGAGVPMRADGIDPSVHELPVHPTHVDALSHHERYRGASVELDPAATRRMAAWTLGLIALALLAILSLNWIVDPTGQTGRTTRWLQTTNAFDRQAKLDGYDALDSTPETLLLGSSRSMKLDPADARELGAGPTYNMAVSGGVPSDMLLLVRYVADQAEAAGEPFPHLVWGLDLDAFRGRELASELERDERLVGYVPPAQRAANSLETFKQLTDLQTTELSLKALWRDLRGFDYDARAAERAERFSERGMQEFELREPDPAGLPAAVRSQMRGYIGFVFTRDGWDGVEQEPREQLEEAIRIANEAGDVPVLWITPYHPLALEQMEPFGYPERRDEALEYVTSLEQRDDLDVQVVDLTELGTFGGDPDGFYDGVHMTPDNTRRVLEHLAGRGLLAGDGTAADS